MNFKEACDAVCAAGTKFEISETDVRGASTKVFVGTPRNIRALFALAASRDDDFLVYEDERWSMRRVLDMAGQLGYALVHELDVKKGDRVAIAMRNYPEWISSFIAITSIGAVAVPLNAWWMTNEIAFALDDSGSIVVLADEEHLTRLSDAADGAIDATIVAVRTSGELPDGVVRLEELMRSGTTMPRGRH